jgi:hypothetical protein
VNDHLDGFVNSVLAHLDSSIPELLNQLSTEPSQEGNVTATEATLTTFTVSKTTKKPEKTSQKPEKSTQFDPFGWVDTWDQGDSFIQWKIMIISI